MTCRCAECGSEVPWPEGEVRQRECNALRFDVICDECAADDTTTLADFRGGPP